MRQLPYRDEWTYGNTYSTHTHSQPSWCFSPCVPYRCWSLHHYKRLHRSPQCRESYTHATPEALGWSGFWWQVWSLNEWAETGQRIEKEMTDENDFPAHYIQDIHQSSLLLTFLAMIIPDGLWHSLLTTPPLPAPSSQIRWKSSSFSSPTLAFWVRKASNRFFCCSSRSSSSSIFLSASKLALRK